VAYFYGRYTAVVENARLEHTMAYTQSADEFAARDEAAPHHRVLVEFETRGFRSWVKFSQFGDLPEDQAVQAQAGMESYFDSLEAYLS
jgi:Activator of Hsp90 ATPase homolog 1-like protein